MSRRQLVIDRSIWFRGEGDAPGGGALLCHDGRRCCIGIYLAACGLPDAILYGRALPEEVAYRHALPAEAAWLLDADSTTNDSTATLDLVRVNDFPRGTANSIDEGSLRDEAKGKATPDEDWGDVDMRIGITEDARERLIAGIFAEHGVDVTFVDGPNQCGECKGNVRLGAGGFSVTSAGGFDEVRTEHFCSAACLKARDVREGRDFLPPAKDGAH